MLTSLSIHFHTIYNILQNQIISATLNTQRQDIKLNFQLVNFSNLSKLCHINLQVKHEELSRFVKNENKYLNDNRNIFIIKDF